MIQDELQNIIEELEAKVSKDKATFGIFQYGGGADESFIKADKEGLKLFALALLHAAQKSADTINNKEKNVITLEFEENWISEQSDTVIHYVEPVAQTQPSEEREKHKDTFIDKLLPVGCYTVLIILLGALLVGLWTLAKWIF
ncbi:hypothetical protein HRG84_24370 [Flavisolibacter sp. BT320]|nr:hypothetical protein [Flavisolibacter longurius]